MRRRALAVHALNTAESTAYRLCRGLLLFAAVCYVLLVALVVIVAGLIGVDTRRR